MARGEVNFIFSWSGIDLFLALLDYAHDYDYAHAHGIELCPLSVRRPSVRRPSVSQLSLNPTNGFLSNLVVSSPGPYAWTFFFCFFLYFWDFFTNMFFAFVNIESYGSENFKTLLLVQIAAESFQTFPAFSSQWSSQKIPRLGFLKFWKLKF